MASSKWENMVEDQKYRSHPCTLPCYSSKFSIVLLNSCGESIDKNSRAAIFQKTLRFPATVYLFLSTLNCQNLKALQDILIQNYKFYLNIFENEWTDNCYSLLSLPARKLKSHKTMKILEIEVGYLNKESQYSFYCTKSTWPLFPEIAHGKKTRASFREPSTLLRGDGRLHRKAHVSRGRKGGKRCGRT